MSDKVTVYTGGPKKTAAEYAEIMNGILDFHGITTCEDIDVARVNVSRIAAEKGQAGCIVRISYEILPLDDIQHAAE